MSCIPYRAHCWYLRVVHGGAFVLDLDGELTEGSD